MDNQQVMWSQQDHDLLIAVKTILENISGELKNYYVAHTSLELRVRALEDLRNKSNGGFKTIGFIGAIIVGIASFIIALIALLNYFALLKH